MKSAGDPWKQLQFLPFEVVAAARRGDWTPLLRLEGTFLVRRKLLKMLGGDDNHLNDAETPLVQGPEGGSRLSGSGEHDASSALEPLQARQITPCVLPTHPPTLSPHPFHFCQTARIIQGHWSDPSRTKKQTHRAMQQEILFFISQSAVQLSNCVTGFLGPETVVKPTHRVLVHPRHLSWPQI